jgi:hypothetical protein
MHPSPMAETVNPSVPSRRVFISVVPIFVTAPQAAFASAPAATTPDGKIGLGRPKLLIPRQFNTRRFARRRRDSGLYV